MVGTFAYYSSLRWEMGVVLHKLDTHSDVPLKMEEKRAEFV